jgi:hypothetical protein
LRIRIGAAQARASHLRSSILLLWAHSRQTHVPTTASDGETLLAPFERRMLAGMIRAGLATIEGENVKAGSRIGITEAGRRVLERY